MVSKKTEGVEFAVVELGPSTKVIGEENAPIIYSDRIEVSVQFFDVKLKLQQIIRAKKDDVVIRHAATLVVSPQHLKSLAKAMANAVESYERGFGAIPEGPSDEEPKE